MPAASSDNHDFNILRRASHRHWMLVGEFRRADRHQPPVPHHRDIVHGTQMDVLANHIFSVPGIFEHHSVIRRQDEHQWARYIGVIGAQGRAGIGDGIQQIMAVQTQKIDDVVLRFRLQDVDGRGFGIVLFLVDHFPLRQRRLFSKAIGELRLGCDAVKVAYAGDCAAHIQDHKVHRPSDRCVFRIAWTQTSLLA